MQRFLKIFLSLVTLVFTLVLVAFFLVLNLDPNNHKDWIANQFHATTGLELELNGDIGLTFYPWLGVSMNDVVVHNAPGFSETPLFQAGHAEFRAKLLPMLSREYEIDTIRLANTSIHLETNAAGQANWNVALPATDAGNESATTGPAFNNLVVGGADIQDAALTFDDRFNNVRYDITDLSASTGELVYGQPIDLFLGLNASATQPALAAQINFSGTVVYDLDNERYDLTPFNLTGTLRGDNVPGGSAAFSMTTAASLDFSRDMLTLRDFSLGALDAQFNANINAYDITGAAPRYQVNLAAAGTDLGVIFQVLENDGLVQQINSMADRSFSLTALVESSPATGDLSLSGLEARLLDADITGDIQVQNLQTETPVISGVLNASGPDLPTLLEVAGQFQGGRDSELARYGRELQQSPDQGFLVNTRFDANLETGTIELPELQIRVLGSTINGNISAANINTDTPVLNGLLNANGPDLPLMLQIAGQVSGGRESALNQYGRQLRGVSNRTFNITAPFDIDMARGNINVSGLEASFLGLRVDGNLQAQNFETAGGTMTGQLTVTGRNLREVLTAVGQNDLAEVLQSLDMAVTINGPRNNLAINPASLDLVLSGPHIPNSPATLALDTGLTLDLDNDTLTSEAITLAGLGLNLQGTVTATNFSSDNPAFNGSLSIPAFNLRGFMQQVNQPLPATTDTAAFQAVALATRFNGTDSDLQLENLDITLDDSRLTGNATVAGLGEDTLPALDFDIAINSINLDRYLAPADTAAASNNSASSELPTETLRELNVRGSINVGQLILLNLAMTDLAVAINASDGLLALAPLSANLYQGSYSGDIRLDASSDIPAASIETALTGINLGPLLQDFMEASYLTGSGNVSLALNGRGIDTDSIKRSLNGTGSLQLQDGVLDGVDVGSVLAQVESMIREQRARTVTRGERTPFETFSASIAVNNGVVTTNDLLIDSSGFAVTGRGTLVDLANDTIAFNLVAMVDENPATNERDYDIGGYNLPIACSGTLSTPRCLPDIQTILAGAISSAVQRGLTDLLQRAIGNEDQPEEDASTDSTAEEEEETDPRQELFNRALENLFNR